MKEYEKKKKVVDCLGPPLNFDIIFSNCATHHSHSHTNTHSHKHQHTVESALRSPILLYVCVVVLWKKNNENTQINQA